MDTTGSVGLVIERDMGHSASSTFVARQPARIIEPTAIAATAVFVMVAFR
jgi:hypothetical protein